MFPALLMMYLISDQESACEGEEEIVGVDIDVVENAESDQESACKKEEEDEDEDKEEEEEEEEEEIIGDEDMKVVENAEASQGLFKELTELYQDSLVVYTNEFECVICLEKYEPPHDGIILQECLHVFCRQCLVNFIESFDGADVLCPFRNKEYTCESIILEHEIKSLLSKEAYEKRLSKTLALAEASISNIFHCLTPDCVGWCISDGNLVFPCPVCGKSNCIVCKAIHDGLSCSDYQDFLQEKSETNITSKMSESAIRDLVACGEAMRCPKCNAAITKPSGCDGLICSFCKTSLCWATKGYRWGPGGVGDTSGGCQCNVNGRKCHPSCGNCH